MKADIEHTDCQLVLTDGTGEALLPDLPVPVVRVDQVRPEGGGTRPLLGQPESLPPPETLWVLLFTSGSSGRPKAVRGTQGRYGRAGAWGGFRATDVLYSAMPLFHGNALSANLLPATAGGSTIVLKRKFSARDVLPDVRRHGVTFFNSVGRALGYILATPPTDEDKDHKLRLVMAPEASPADIKAFEDRFGCRIYTGYGQSEGAIVIIPTADPAAWGRRLRAWISLLSTRHRSGTSIGPLRRAGRAHERRRSDRRTRTSRSRRSRSIRGLLQQPRGRRRAPTRRLVLVRRPRLPDRGRDLLLRRPRRATGCGSTRRTSRRRRSSGSSVRSNPAQPSPSTACPIPSRATRSWPHSSYATGATFDPDAFAALPRRPPRSRYEVGAPVRADRRHRADHGPRKDQQAAPKGRGMADDRSDLVATAANRGLPTVHQRGRGRARCPVRRARAPLVQYEVGEALALPALAAEAARRPA